MLFFALQRFGHVRISICWGGKYEVGSLCFEVPNMFVLDKRWPFALLEFDRGWVRERTKQTSKKMFFLEIKLAFWYIYSKSFISCKTWYFFLFRVLWLCKNIVQSMQTSERSLILYSLQNKQKPPGGIEALAVWMVWKKDTKKNTL